MTSNRSSLAPARAEGLPTFLIVGAMRSGTTSLARYLGDHPDVFVARKKELHFFDREFDRGVGWYREQFAAGGASHVGEATATYMYEPEALERIARTLPKARLIAILRDPVERAYSHYRMNRAAGGEPLSFEDALAAEGPRLSMGTRARRMYSYVDRGRYLRQLQEIGSRFDQEQIVVLLFEDLRDRPEGTFAGLCRRLGVDDGYVPDRIGAPINPSVRFRSRGLRRFGRRMPRTLARAIGRVNEVPAPLEPIASETRRRLAGRFRDDNSELARWLGRDLSEWSR